jgi:exoribonuclease R
MRIHTKDHIRFQIYDNDICVREFEGVEHANHALPGDEVLLDGTLVKRAEHPLIVGIVYLQSKTKYGITSKGAPIYLFEPINKAYPLMIVGSTEKSTSVNKIGLVKFESWEPGSKYPRASLVNLIGPCGDLVAEQQSLLSRYSPWKYPKAFEISAGYGDALKNRPLVKGFTFNIDPPGCEDVDDVFTLEKVNVCTWALTVSITDVATAIEEGSILDTYAQKVGQTLYPIGAPPKHMLPPSLGTKNLSLLPGCERNCISLRILWSTLTGLRVGDPEFSLTKVSVDKAYTYAEAQKESREEFATLRHIAEAIANTSLPTSEEIVEALMIYYNKEVGRVLKLYQTGILRSHSAPNQERLTRWESIDPALKMLAYSSATYVPGNTAAFHWGLSIDNYAHASSPLRRYSDLYNQRCLLRILHNDVVTITEPSVCTQLNTLQKDAKSFDRDMFFLSVVSESNKECIGIVLDICIKKGAVKLWVPLWKRVIRVSCDLVQGETVSIVPRDSKEIFPVQIGQELSLTYYIKYDSARWKDRIVFHVSPKDGGRDYPE